MLREYFFWNVPVHRSRTPEFYSPIVRPGKTLLSGVRAFRDAQHLLRVPLELPLQVTPTRHNTKQRCQHTKGNCKPLTFIFQQTRLVSRLIRFSRKRTYTNGAVATAGCLLSSETRHFHSVCNSWSQNPTRYTVSSPLLKACRHNGCKSSPNRQRVCGWLVFKAPIFPCTHFQLNNEHKTPSERQPATKSTTTYSYLSRFDVPHQNGAGRRSRYQMLTLNQAGVKVGESKSTFNSHGNNTLLPN